MHGRSKQVRVDYAEPTRAWLIYARLRSTVAVALDAIANCCAFLMSACARFLAFFFPLTRLAPMNSSPVSEAMDLERVRPWKDPGWPGPPDNLRAVTDGYARHP
jgi:hypothetical protein